MAHAPAWLSPRRAALLLSVFGGTGLYILGRYGFGWHRKVLYPPGLGSTANWPMWLRDCIPLELALSIGYLWLALHIMFFRLRDIKEGESSRHYDMLFLLGVFLAGGAFLGGLAGTFMGGAAFGLYAFVIFGLCFVVGLVFFMTVISLLFALPDFYQKWRSRRTSKATISL